MTDRNDGLTAELLRAGFEDRLPVDDDARRRSFDAALAAFDEAVEPHRTSVVVEVDAQPGSRRPPRRGVPPFTLLSIAALAIALAGVVVVLTRGGDERVRTGVADDPVELPALPNRSRSLRVRGGTTTGGEKRRQDKQGKRTHHPQNGG